MQIRGNFYVQTQTKEKEKWGNFEITNLNLEPHLISPLSSETGGNCATPLKDQKAHFSGLCWNQEGIGWAWLRGTQNLGSTPARLGGGGWKSSLCRGGWGFELILSLRAST